MSLPFIQSAWCGYLIAGQILSAAVCSVNVAGWYFTHFWGNIMETMMKLFAEIPIDRQYDNAFPCIGADI